VGAATNSRGVVSIEAHYPVSGRVVWTLNGHQQNPKQLYSKARTWWLNDKNAFDLEREIDPFGVADSLRIALVNWGVLSRVPFIPQMKEAHEADWIELLDWLQELRAIDAFSGCRSSLHTSASTNEAENFEKLIAEDLTRILTISLRSSESDSSLDSSFRVRSYSQSLLQLL